MKPFVSMFGLLKDPRYTDFTKVRMISSENSTGEKLVTSSEASFLPCLLVYLSEQKGEEISSIIHNAICHAGKLLKEQTELKQLNCLTKLISDPFTSCISFGWIILMRPDQMADSCQGPIKYDQKQIPGQCFPFIKQQTLCQACTDLLTGSCLKKKSA